MVGRPRAFQRQPIASGDFICRAGPSRSVPASRRPRDTENALDSGGFLTERRSRTQLEARRQRFERCRYNAAITQDQVAATRRLCATNFGVRLVFAGFSGKDANKLEQIFGAIIPLRISHAWHTRWRSRRPIKQSRSLRPEIKLRVQAPSTAPTLCKETIGCCLFLKVMTCRC